METFLIDGQFGNGVGSGIFDVLHNILSKIRPIEILLKDCHHFLGLEMPSYSTVVRFPNHLHTLSCRNILVSQVA